MWITSLVYEAICAKFTTNAQGSTFQASDDLEPSCFKMFWDKILPNGFQFRNLYEKLQKLQIIADTRRKISWNYTINLKYPKGFP